MFLTKSGVILFFIIIIHTNKYSLSLFYVNINQLLLYAENKGKMIAVHSKNNKIKYIKIGSIKSINANPCYILFSAALFASIGFWQPFLSKCSIAFLRLNHTCQSDLQMSQANVTDSSVVCASFSPPKNPGNGSQKVHNEINGLGVLCELH
jgi:hypothetical protein